jgi:hypothetical protein
MSELSVKNEVITEEHYPDKVSDSACYESGSASRYVLHKMPSHSNFNCRTPRRPGFQARSDYVGFVVDRVTLVQAFSEYFSFPCQLSFHQMIHIHLSSGAGTIGPLLADVPSGLSLTPSHEIKKN